MRVAVLLVVLTGCVSGQPDLRPPPLEIGVRALHPIGSDLEISLGRAEEGVIPAITRLVGAPPSEVTDQPGCGRRYVWPGGLALTFRDGDLAGWRATGAGYASRSGVVVGAPMVAGDAGGVRTESRGGRFVALAAGLTCPAQPSG